MTSKQTTPKTTKKDLIIKSSPITPHSQAVYETGKAILIDSVTASREFCKTMIGISASAIPLYLGILSYLLPKDYVLGVNAGAIIAAPAVGFLITTVTFVGGYSPLVRGEFSLNHIEEIDAVREDIISYRNRFVVVGLITFMLSTLLAIIAIVINIGVR
jgi:hypothetical protein